MPSVQNKKSTSKRPKTKNHGNYTDEEASGKQYIYIYIFRVQIMVGHLMIFI